MLLDQPAVVKDLLSKLAESIGEYACYMAENGAQVIQVFDSWAASLSARGSCVCFFFKSNQFNFEKRRFIKDVVHTIAR
jgi:uroporphyrinogen-III decarboxylase